MARNSLTRAYQKIQELSWEPTFATPVKKYPTDYKFTKAPKKEPLKQVMQSYFPMQEEKDNRSMGVMDSVNAIMRVSNMTESHYPLDIYIALRPPESGPVSFEALEEQKLLTYALG